MAEAAGPVTFLEPTASARRWRAFFVVSSAILASTLLLRVANVQYLEWIDLLNLAVLLRVFYYRRFQLQGVRWYLGTTFAYGAFGALALVFAIASLRFQFYIPSNITWQTKPVMITVQRLVELVCAVSSMVYLAHIFLEEPAWLKRAVQIYTWTAVASVVYSIVTWPLAYLNIIQLGTYLTTHRFRGFFNEGGPWGLYIVSASVVMYAGYRQGWFSRRQAYVAGGLLLYGLVFSYSKASIVMLLALILLNVFMSGSMTRRIVLLFSLVVVIGVGSVAVNLMAALRLYASNAEAYERASFLHSKDASFVAGRVAGAFIVPRMIAAHPLTGIGWGNYPLLRNSPEYRGASVWYDSLDDPGLGLATYIAHLGVPLAMYLMVCLCLPVILLRKRGCPTYMLNVGLMQPLTMVFGAQLNLTYPWIVSAFALAMAYASHSDSRPEPLPAQLP